MVVVLNDAEVGKLFADDTRSDIGSEAEKMSFANEVNGLVVRFHRLDTYADTGADMLVMERLIPLDYRSHEEFKRELWLDVFRDEIRQLHEAGFVHRDIRRPSELKGQPFDNVLLTDKGLRLIDVGISALRSKVGDKLFDKFVEQEKREIEEFAAYFLER